MAPSRQSSRDAAGPEPDPEIRARRALPDPEPPAPSIGPVPVEPLPFRSDRQGTSQDASSPGAPGSDPDPIPGTTPSGSEFRCKSYLSLASHQCLSKFIHSMVVIGLCRAFGTTHDRSDFGEGVIVIYAQN